MKIIPLIIFLFFNSLLFSQKLNYESNYYQSRVMLPRDTTSFEKVNFRRSHSVFNIAQQIVIGSAGMVIPSSILFVAAFASAWGGDRYLSGLFTLLSVPAYLFGTAGAVHWVASHENPNNSFWGTFGYTSIGFGVGLTIVGALSTKYTTIPKTGGIIAYVAPLISALIYSNFIADWQVPTNREVEPSGNLTLYELRDRDMVFNLNILSVRF